jgi:hypothetical protein
LKFLRLIKKCVIVSRWCKKICQSGGGFTWLVLKIALSPRRCRKMSVGKEVSFVMSTLKQASLVTSIIEKVTRFLIVKTVICLTCFLFLFYYYMYSKKLALCSMLEAACSVSLVNTWLMLNSGIEEFVVDCILRNTLLKKKVLWDYLFTKGCVRVVVYTSFLHILIVTSFYCLYCCNVFYKLFS